VFLSRSYSTQLEMYLMPPCLPNFRSRQERYLSQRLKRHGTRPENHGSCSLFRKSFIEVLHQLGSQRVCSSSAGSGEGIVFAPQFGARSNYIKSNHLRGVRVPNLCLFGTVSTKNPR
jgi:hypothetical protein